jgi:hypothetical protein
MLNKRFTKKKYRCPICYGSYSRRWVWERHFNSMHGFSHSSSITRSRQSSNYQIRKTNGLQLNYDFHYSDGGDPLTHTLKLFDVASRLAETNHVPKVINENVYLKSLIGSIAENCYPLLRDKISGISSFVCGNCHAFETTIVKDLGFDKIARYKHSCKRDQLEAAVKLNDRPLALQNQIKLAHNYLLVFINWWIPGKKILVARRMPPYVSTIYDIEESILRFRFPLSKIFVTDRSWLENVISKKAIELEEKDLVDFIENTGGSYCVFPIKGESAFNLIYITGQ